jgi:hypothetical protein
MKDNITIDLKPLGAKVERLTMFLNGIRCLPESYHINGLTIEYLDPILEKDYNFYINIEYDSGAIWNFIYTKDAIEKNYEKDKSQST